MTARGTFRRARDTFSLGRALCCLFVKQGKKGGEVCNCEKERRGASGMYHPAACYTARARRARGPRKGARAREREKEERRAVVKLSDRCNTT